MNVSELARRAATTSETVRHYTDIGLLRPRRNPDNGYRLYDRDDLRRLNFALQARSLGFTLADICQLVKESETGHSPCATTRQLIEQRLAEVEARIRELRRLSGRMQEALTAWKQQPACCDETPASEAASICPLIESFARDEVVPGQA